MNRPYRQAVDEKARLEHDRLIERRHHIDNAKRAVREIGARGTAETADALMHVIACLEEIQRGDERVFELHRECVAMVETASRALQLHAELTQPVVIKVDG